MNINQYQGNYIYDKNGKTIGVRVSSEEGKHLVQENSSNVHQQGEWLTFDAKVNLSEGISVDKLGINEVTSAFLEGNLTTDEFKKWFGANNVKGYKIIESADDKVEISFKYNNKEYSLNCSWEVAQRQTDKPSSNESPAAGANVSSGTNSTGTTNTAAPQTTVSSSAGAFSSKDDIKVNKSEDAKERETAIKEMDLEPVPGHESLYRTKTKVNARYVWDYDGIERTSARQLYYVWNASENRMQEAVDIAGVHDYRWERQYSIDGINSHDVTPVSYAILCAEKQGMSQTKINGLYQKGDSYYVFHDNSDTFNKISEKELQFYIERGYVKEQEQQKIKVVSDEQIKAEKAAAQTQDPNQPHYPQGYTLEELNKELYIEGPDAPGKSYVLNKNVACRKEFLEMLFVKDGDKYYLRSNFEMNGKKYESLDDVRKMLKNTYNSGTYYYGPGTVTATLSDIKNCGYNFVDGEIEAYFDKNSDGTYTLKEPAVVSGDRQDGFAFYTFDDFVHYLKGEPTGARGMSYWDMEGEEPHYSITYGGSYNYIRPPQGTGAGLISQYEMDLFMNKGLPSSVAFSDFNFTTLFNKTQHGDYTLNKTAIKNLLGDAAKGINSLDDLRGKLDELEQKADYEENGEVHFDDLGNAGIPAPTHAQLTETEAKALGFSVVKTANELAQALNNSSAKVMLFGDIDLSEVQWTPVGTQSVPFTGQLNGNGFTISNLNLSDNSYYTGLFGVTDGATIYNINFKNMNIESTNRDPVKVGDRMEETGTGIVGYAKNTTFDTIEILNSSVSGRDSVGMIAGKMDGGIINSVCINHECSIKGGYKVGSVVGNVINIDSVGQVHSEAPVYGGVFLSGIFGYVENGNLTWSRIDHSYPAGVEVWYKNDGTYSNPPYKLLNPSDETVFSPQNKQEECYGAISSNVIYPTSGHANKHQFATTVICNLDPKTGEILGIYGQDYISSKIETIQPNDYSYVLDEVFDESDIAYYNADYMASFRVNFDSDEQFEKALSFIEVGSPKYRATNIPNVFVSNIDQSLHYVTYSGYRDEKSNWVSAGNSSDASVVASYLGYEKVKGADNIFYHDGQYYKYAPEAKLLIYNEDIKPVTEIIKEAAAKRWSKAITEWMVPITAEEALGGGTKIEVPKSAAYPPASIGITQEQTVPVQTPPAQALSPAPAQTTEAIPETEEADTADEAEASRQAEEARIAEEEAARRERQSFAGNLVDGYKLLLAEYEGASVTFDSDVKEFVLDFVNGKCTQSEFESQVKDVYENVKLETERKVAEAEAKAKAEEEAEIAEELRVAEEKAAKEQRQILAENKINGYKKLLSHFEGAEEKFVSQVKDIYDQFVAGSISQAEFEAKVTDIYNQINSEEVRAAEEKHIAEEKAARQERQTFADTQINSYKQLLSQFEGASDKFALQSENSVSDYVNGSKTKSEFRQELENIYTQLKAEMEEEEKAKKPDVVLKYDDYAKEAEQNKDKIRVPEGTILRSDGENYYILTEDKQYNYIYDPISHKWLAYESSQLANGVAKDLSNDTLKRIERVLSALKQGLNFTSNPDICCDNAGNYYDYSETQHQYVKRP